MDDAVYTFVQDSKEKKAIGRGARHRVRGSKSKRCSLPSDGMTHAQWKRSNGPVITYNLTKRFVLERIGTEDCGNVEPPEEG